MATTVVKASGTITNPKSTSVTTGEIVTSDTFSGANHDLLGRYSDAGLGGQSVVWKKASNYGAQGLFSINNGVAQAVVKNGIFGAVCLDLLVKNVAIEFKVARFDDGVAGSGATSSVFIDARRIDGTSTTFRLGISKSSMSLLHRNENGTYTDFGSFAYNIGDKIIWMLKENNIKVYVNAVKVIDINHNLTNVKGLVSLARGTLDTDATMAFDDLVVYSI